MIPFMILFLLIAPFISASWDVFYFHISVTCHYQEQPFYTYSIKFYEYDTISNDEELTEWSQEKVIKKGEVGKQIIPGKMDGDGPGSHYEIYAEIQHDCIPGGYRTKTRVYLTAKEDCKEDGKDCYVYAWFDLTDLYVPTEIGVQIKQSE